MNVSVVACGPRMTESERRAFETLASGLQQTKGRDDWCLLTNLSFSQSDYVQSDEIDVLVIGPPGVTVVEVKHWGPSGSGAIPTLCRFASCANCLAYRENSPVRPVTR